MVTIREAMRALEVKANASKQDGDRDDPDGGASSGSAELAEVNEWTRLL